MDSRQHKIGKATGDGTERTLDSLLRGEIAAAETYHQALEKVGDDPKAAPLRAIQQDHGDAIAFFYDELAAREVEPSTSSGAWGAFARAVEGTAVLFGNKAAITALREGEKQGLNSYVDALENGDLPPEGRRFVEQWAVPRQIRHIEVLEEMIAGM